MPGGRFCVHCGGAVSGEEGPPGFSVLRSDVPTHIAEHIQRLGRSLIGERRRVTVLFADMKGSTARISGLDPEDALATIAPVIKILMDAVHAHNGFVNQTRGDGVMALFGAPLTNEGHALDACAAALAMRRAVAAGSGSPEAEAALRIGLHSGEVVIQSIGSDLSMNYDAVGSTVHLAARLEKAAKSGSIFISEATRALVRGQMRTEAKGPLTLDGIPGLVPAYELIDAAPLTRWQARKAQGLGIFTGRSQHIATLADAVSSVASGAGCLVTVTAPPGLGKSRLVHELLINLPAEWGVMQLACSPHRTTSSYHPIAQLSRALIRITPEDSEETIVTRLEAYVRARDPAAAEYIPAYLSVLDVRAADEGWSRLDPVQRRLKVLDAMLAALTSRSALRPILLLVEDVHWCDPETRFILEAVAARAAGVRVLMLVTQRPDGAARLATPATSIDIALEPLDVHASKALVHSLLGGDISLMSVRQHVLQRAEGNPLFIEELVQDLKDRGHLAGEPGAYRLTGTVDLNRMPDSIHAVIAARIDQLDARRKLLLQTAAVIGRNVSVPLLRHMLGRQAHDIDQVLAQLETGDFLYRDGGAEASAYIFKHELIREVAYRSLLIGTRRALHAKAVEFIETTYAERIEEHIDRLADHAFEAQLWAKAIPYQMRSVRRALRRGTNHEAIAICERAQAALQHLPASADRTKAEIDFALAGIIALEPIGRHQRIAALLKDARDKAQALGEPLRVAATNCQLVVALWRIGEHQAAMQAAKAAQAAAAALGDPALIFAARHNMGLVHHETGNFAAAIADFRACIDMETPDIDAKRIGWAALPSVVLRTFLTDCLCETGAYEEAARVGEEGIARAERAGHAYSRVQINQVRSRVMVAQGKPADALALLAADWRISIELDMVQMHPIIATRLGEAHLANGDVAAALDILGQPERLDVPLEENAFGWRYLFLARGHAFLRSGGRGEARDCAQRALALAEARGELPQAAYARALLAEIANAESGGRREARAHFREAARLAQTCGMLPLAARCASQSGGARNLARRTFRRLSSFGHYLGALLASSRMALRPGMKK